MNRRGFLGSLATLAAGLVLDPERLLWVPGQKTIFLPPIPVFGANPNIGMLVAAAWEDAIKRRPADNLFSSRALFEVFHAPQPLRTEIAANG